MKTKIHFYRHGKIKCGIPAQDISYTHYSDKVTCIKCRNRLPYWQNQRKRYQVNFYNTEKKCADIIFLFAKNRRDLYKVFAEEKKGDFINCKQIKK